MSSVLLDLPVSGDRTTAGIVEMPHVLQWQSDAEEADRVHREYALLLADRLGSVLAATLDNPRTAKLRKDLEALPGSAWLRLLTAPRVSYRLLWPSRHDPSETAVFLADAAEVELAAVRAGNEHGELEAVPTPGARWSVLGDGWLDDGDHFVSTPGLPGFAPIDFWSPHSLAIDLEGVTDETDLARVPYDSAVIRNVLRDLAEVRDAMSRATPDVLTFAVGFTKVLILQPDPEAPTSFSTGSSAQYVGRSVFGNPHLDSVDGALLAEGLVHEAIHSYMYMVERIEPWVTDVDLYGPEHRTRSLWTGHPLPLRAYLQACFVWYGLLHFWGRAMGAGAFETERARERLMQAARGFLAGDVLEQVETYRAGIVPELLSAIEWMQRDVLAAVEEVGVAG